MAECMLGHGNRAYEYYRASMPAAYNDRAEIRQSEPYVQAQTTYSTYSPRAGNTRTSWLTGAAAWSYFSATQALKKVKVLSGLIPICASCKKIRDDKGYWNNLESYLKAHSDADFTHGICPECAKKWYPQISE